MFSVGAHVSISGGVHKAVEEQQELGGTTGQIFVGSPRSWSVSTIDEDSARKFQHAVEDLNIGPWIVHGTYLINFATPKDDLAEKSISAVQEELNQTSRLDIPYYVFHPGSHTGAGIEKGIQNVAERLSKIDIPENTTLLLENTAGKGTTTGKTFEELERMVKLSDHGWDTLGVCVDTCHLFAAGYEFSTDDQVSDLINEIEDTVGMENIHYLHLNDSKHPLGSQKDEHEHIGEGKIGVEGFQTLLNNRAFRDLPMVLETPVDDKGYDWNIDTIQDLYQPV